MNGSPITIAAHGLCLGFGVYAGVRLAQYLYGPVSVRNERDAAPCECASTAGVLARLRASVSELEALEAEARSGAEKARKLLENYDAGTFAPSSPTAPVAAQEEGSP